MFFVYLKSHLSNCFWNSLVKSPCMARYWMHGYHRLQFFLRKTKLNTRQAPCAIAFTDAHPLSWLQVLWIQRAEMYFHPPPSSVSALTQIRQLPPHSSAALLKIQKSFSTTANSKQSVSLLFRGTLEVRGRRKDIHLVVLWLSSKMKKNLRLPKTYHGMVCLLQKHYN